MGEGAENPSDEIVLAIHMAEAAVDDSKSIRSVVDEAVHKMPTDKDAAEKYCSVMLRLAHIAEAVVRDTRVAYMQKFGT